MPPAIAGGALALADDLVLSRMGYGAMRLAGPGVFGPPEDRREAIAVLRTAVDPAELTAQVHENLEQLGLDVLDVVNFRQSVHAAPDSPIAEPFGALAGLRREGLIRHLGLSGVSAAQLTEAQGIAPVLTVPNRVRTSPPETSMTAGRPTVRSSIESAGPSGSPSRRNSETGNANQWLRNSSPSSGWAMYLIPQPPRASSTGWSWAPASVSWNSVVATGGAASSRRTRPADSRSCRRSASRLVAMPGRPFLRSV